MKIKLFVVFFIALIAMASLATIACASTDESTYIVQKGDTLSKIAKAYYGDYKQYIKIFEANPFLKSPDLIYPGQKLVLPNLDSQPNKVDIQVSRANESRGQSEGPIIMSVTAYSLDYRCCGKYPDHPEYGITYSGECVKEWYTVAAGKELPLGTTIYIPYFKDKPNKGIFVVRDRGSGVGYHCIDVYMDVPYEQLMKFGRKSLEVFIIKRGNGK